MNASDVGMDASVVGMDASKDLSADFAPGREVAPSKICNPAASDCSSSEYCQAPNCTTLGTCMPRPVVSSPIMSPACGCKGTTYWNVQHARWLGATAFPTTGLVACSPNTAATCAKDADCVALGGRCVIHHGLGPASCTNGKLGQCWAIPPDASCANTPAGGEGYGSCRLGPNTCNANALNHCRAIIDGNYFAICL